jgi:outer membrane protein
VKLLHDKLAREGTLEMRARSASLCSLTPLLVVLASATGCTFTGKPAVPPQKIGVVDVQRVQKNAQSLTAQLAQLQQEVAQEQKHLDQARAAWEKKVQLFEEEEAGLGEDERSDRRARIQQERKDLQREFREAEERLGARKSELEQAALQDIVVAAKAVGAEEDYDLIFQTHEGLLWQSPKADTTTLDITDKIIAKLAR